jgi:hypothetical protein
VGASPRVGGDAVGEEPGVDAQPRREPLDRLGGRAGLAALDLADVLLGEPVAGELGLREAGGDAKEPEAVSEPRARMGGGGAVGGGDLGHGGGGGPPVDGVKREVERAAYPFAGILPVRTAPRAK